MNIISPAAFWLPEYKPETAWLGHAPFAFWLVETLRPHVLVELGAYHGCSYFCFCQAVKRLGLDTKTFAVDTWQGDDLTNYYDEDVYESVLEHNKQYKFSTLVRLPFNKAIAQFSDHSIDILHIDGDHSYEAVSHDFWTWLPKVTPGGVILLHDTNVDAPGYGVYRFYEEIEHQFSSFKFLHTFGLGVVAPHGIHPKLVDLISLSEDKADSARNAYALLAHTMEYREKRNYSDHEIYSMSWTMNESLVA